MGLRDNLLQFVRSVRYAIAGIKHAFLSERHVQIHFVVACFVIICAFLFSVSKMEWLILIVVISVTISLELINTAIERVVDIVTGKYHPLAKAAKDCAAGAVFISAISSVIIGCIIFIPRLFELFTK